MAAAGPDEEVVPATWPTRRRSTALVRGCDAIVHLGGVSMERPFEEILEANIKGVFHLYEGARRHGVQARGVRQLEPRDRLPQAGRVLDGLRPRRPDGYYGLSKAYGEDLSRFYFDRYGIETACLRIGSSFPEPEDRRMLGDLAELSRPRRSWCRCCLFAPSWATPSSMACPRTATLVGQQQAAHLGFIRRTTPSVSRQKVETQPPWVPIALQGGAFVSPAVRTRADPQVRLPGPS
jgi:uronate dehydrogenase